MRIDTVELKNIGVIRERTFDLRRDLIAVVGPNGSGKSTLMNSVYAALSNDFSRFGSSKASAINNASEGERSYIRVTGRCGTREFQLTRSLTPSRSEFSWVGGERFTKASDIETVIKDALGVSKVILDNYVFVPQGGMFDFLQQTPNVRAKMFQHMCGVEEAAAVHQACYSFINRHRPRDVLDTTPQLDASIAQIKNELAFSRTQVKAAVRSMLTAARTAELQEAINRTASYQQEAAKLPGIQHSLQQAEQGFERASTAATALLSTYTARTAWLNSQKDVVQRIQEARAEAQRFATVQARTTDLTRKLETSKAQLAGLARPDESLILSDDSFRDMFESCAGARTRIAQYSSVVNQTRKQCPTCLQSIDESHVRALQDRANESSSVIATLEPKISLSQETQQRLTQYRSHVASLTATIQHSEEQLKLLSSTQQGAVVVSQEELDLLSQYLQHDNHAQKEKAQLDGLEQQKASAQASIEVWKNAERAVYAAMANCGLPLTEAELASARQAVNSDTNARQVYAIHRSMHSSRVGLLHSLYRQRTEMQETLAQVEEQRAAFGVVETIMQTFHWDSLPRRVTHQNLQMLVSDINSNLHDFQSPFTVEATDELSFQVYFPDRNPLEASQLSGGQKVMLALAFRLSLDKIFGGAIGMLFFDEPSAGLDVSNQTIFYETLRDIVARTREPRQVVVVTHTSGLGKFFDSVVEM
jgi:DNA repair exonuclease SbcCD ATPase subunit